MSTCVAREHHQYFIIEVSVTFRSSYKIFAARLPARETQHYSTSSAHLVWKTYPICLAETPPPKISRFKPCLLARYTADHLNTSLLGSSSNALVDIFFSYFLHCRADSPVHLIHGARIVSDALKKCGFRPAGTDLHFLQVDIVSLLSCCLHIQYAK